jgi:hypothetical protein
MRRAAASSCLARSFAVFDGLPHRTGSTRHDAASWARHGLRGVRHAGPRRCALPAMPRAADTLVTPLNDSFVDFDLIGQVDAETFKVRRLSFYAELIWEARKKRAMATIGEQRGAKSTGWCCATALQHVEARNMRRVDKRAGRAVEARRLPRDPRACPSA